MNYQGRIYLLPNWVPIPGGVWANFARPRDGLVMANALHFQNKKDSLIPMLRGYLRPARRFFLVEYNNLPGQSLGAALALLLCLGAPGQAERL